MFNMKSTMLLIAGLLVAGCANAQVRKCTGPDGKVTYSDFVCGINTAHETGVKTSANTIDASGLRQESQKYKTAEAVEQAMQQGASKCKFSYYAIGDSKGKELAATAKQECLSNIASKASGLPNSLEAYNFWKDHAALKSGERQNAVNRASATADARMIANSNEVAIRAAVSKNEKRSMTCTPSIYRDALDCK